MACQLSPLRPHPVSGLISPASVYVMVSRSGLLRRPCSSRSSPTLTMAVTCAGSTTWMIPDSIRAAPTPPASTVTNESDMAVDPTGAPGRGRSSDLDDAEPGGQPPDVLCVIGGHDRIRLERERGDVG